MVVGMRNLLALGCAALLAGAQAQVVNFRQELLDAVNAEREAQSLEPFCLNELLMNAAQVQANDMAENNFIKSTGSDGSTPEKRAKAEGFDGASVTEVVGAGYRSAETIIAAWTKSASAKKAIFGKYTVMGPGYTFDKTKKFVHFWAVDFAQGECGNATSTGAGGSGSLDTDVGVGSGSEAPKSSSASGSVEAPASGSGSAPASSTSGSAPAAPTSGSGSTPAAPPAASTSGSGSEPATPPAASTEGSGSTPAAPPAASTSGSGSAPAAPPAASTTGSGSAPASSQEGSAPAASTTGSGEAPAAASGSAPAASSGSAPAASGSDWEDPTQ